MILDKSNLQRPEYIEQLPEEDIFIAIDNLIKATKLKYIAAL